MLIFLQFPSNTAIHALFLPFSGINSVKMTGEQEGLLEVTILNNSCWLAQR